MPSIINVKASFQLLESNKLDKDSVRYLFYSAGHLQVLKTGSYTYSIMGRDNRYVNVTGCPAIERLAEGIELFKQMSHVKLINNIKINSISFLFKAQISDNILTSITSSPSRVFNIKRFPKSH